MLRKGMAQCRTAVAADRLNGPAITGLFRVSDNAEI